MKTIYYFYKIACLNSKITDCYIGSTCNFKNRYIHHKSDCNNENNISYNHKKYQFIRSNGGWGNWIMYPIDILESDDKVVIRQKENELMELHNSTLNSHNAYTDRKKYIRDYYIDNIDYYKEHNRIYRINNKDYFHELNNQKFICECGGKFTYASKSQHLRTIKHQQFICQQIN